MDPIKPQPAATMDEVLGFVQSAYAQERLRRDIATLFHWVCRLPADMDPVSLRAIVTSARAIIVQMVRESRQLERRLVAQVPSVLEFVKALGPTAPMPAPVPPPRLTPPAGYYLANPGRTPSPELQQWSGQPGFTPPPGYGAVHAYGPYADLAQMFPSALLPPPSENSPELIRGNVDRAFGARMESNISDEYYIGTKTPSPDECSPAPEVVVKKRGG